MLFKADFLIMIKVLQITMKLTKHQQIWFVLSNTCFLIILFWKKNQQRGRGCNPLLKERLINSFKIGDFMYHKNDRRFCKAMRILTSFFDFFLTHCPQNHSRKAWIKIPCVIFLKCLLQVTHNNNNFF